MVHFTRACKTLLSENNKTRLTFEKQQEKNKNIICRPWSVRIEKNCALGLEHGPRPAASGRTQDLWHSFSQYGPPGRQIIYMYFIDLYHWNGLAKVGSFGDNDDGTEKRPTTYVVATGCLIVTLVVLFYRNQAQKLFNNKTLLAECERIQQDDLRKAELLQKDLKRDVKVKLPSCKNQLVPLYAPLQPRFKSE